MRFFFVRLFLGHPHLSAELTPDSMLRGLYGMLDRTWFGHMQGQHHTCYIITPAPKILDIKWESTRMLFPKILSK